MKKVRSNSVNCQSFHNQNNVYQPSNLSRFDREDVPETDEIRTLLTSLLDCGEVLCREIVGLLLKGAAAGAEVIQVVDLVSSTFNKFCYNSVSQDRLI